MSTAGGEVQMIWAQRVGGPCLVIIFCLHADHWGDDGEINVIQILSHSSWDSDDGNSYDPNLKDTAPLMQIYCCC